MSNFPLTNFLKLLHVYVYGFIRSSWFYNYNSTVAYRDTLLIMSVQIQEVIQRLPIVLLSHKLSVGKKDLGHAKRSSSTVGQAVRERQWTDVPAGEECAIHLELTQHCLARRVSSCTIYACIWVLIACLVKLPTHYNSYTPFMRPSLIII